jgi:hypothetical protein
MFNIDTIFPLNIFNHRLVEKVDMGSTDMQGSLLYPLSHIPQP